MENNQKEFEDLMRMFKEDENVLGAMLTGSRGKGFEHPASDYDLQVVVVDDVASEYKEKFEKISDSRENDVTVSSISNFRTYTEPGTRDEWYKYAFTHVEALIDKTGEIQDLINTKGSVSGKYRERLIEDGLGGYLNGVFRVLKQIERKDVVGARFVVVKYIPDLLNAIFALHGRPRPFEDYLKREVGKYPLQKMSWSGGEFLDALTKLLCDVDVHVQEQLLVEMEKMFRKEGFGKHFDEWKGNRIERIWLEHK